MSRLSLSSLALAVAACTLFAAQPANAYCRALAKPKSGVCDQACGANTLVYWNTRNFKWELTKPASGTIQGMPWDDVKAAMVRSATSWQNISCSDLKFEFTGPTSEFKTGYDSACGATNANRIIFRAKACSEAGLVPAGDECLTKGSCGRKYDCWDHDSSAEGPIALTTTTFDNQTGQIVDGDMEFNASNRSTGEMVNHFSLSDAPVCDATATPPLTATDIENTATHEFGHFLGLGHSLDMDATMYISAKPCETSKRDLSQDDIDAICAIYPKGGQTAYCTAPVAPECPGEDIPNKGPCSSLGGADLLALSIAAAMIRRRRFQGKNL